MVYAISEKHLTKVAGFMLDVMCPLITEADAVSQELLEVILAYLLEPSKVSDKYRNVLLKSNL